MKLISWNVNGLRACLQKGFLEAFERMDADFFCLQETKLQPDQLQLDLPGYYQYWNYAQKKGYSGTAIFAKHEPLPVQYGIGLEEFDNEGRVITLEYQEFFLVTCYTPNAQRGLARLDFRMAWDEAFRGFLSALDAKKPVILCGDLNVAHQEIDLKNPKSNRGSAGFSDEERESFTKTLDMGFTDTFRHLNPDAIGIYSWWSYMYHARDNNAGWRIDYFLVSDRVKEHIYRTPIYTDIFGSDHCPVGLEIDLLCNGSLWSPSSLGKARDITPQREKKTNPTAKTVLTTLLLLVLLAGGIFADSRILPGKADSPQPDSLQNTTGTEGTDPTGVSALFTATVLPEAPVTREFSSFLSSTIYHGDPDYSLLEYSPNSDTLTKVPNFWIYVELTEAGLQQHQQGDFPIVVTASSSVNLQVAIRSCFSFPRNQSGFLIYGYIDKESFLLISYGSEGISVPVTPCENQNLLSPQSISIDDSFVCRFNDVTGENQFYVIKNGVEYALSDGILNTDPQHIDFWVLLELNQAGLMSSNPDIPPTFQMLLPPGATDNCTLEIAYYQSTRSKPSRQGWVIYGNAPLGTELQITYDTEYWVTVTAPATPINPR